MRKTPLPAQNVSITPGPVYLVPFVGGNLNFCSSHIFDLVHQIILIQMNSCLPEQRFPGNWITDVENTCYPNSLQYYLYPVTLVRT